MPSVLFVCTANQFRSPLAAACLREELQKAGLEDGWTIESAGTWAVEGHPISLQVLRAFWDLGIDLQGHSTRTVSAELLNRFDLVLVMEAGQREALRVEFPSARGKVFLLSEVVDGLAYDIPDPGRSSRHSFAEVAEELRGLVHRGFAAIRAKAEGFHDR